MQGNGLQNRKIFLQVILTTLVHLSIKQDCESMITKFIIIFAVVHLISKFSPK